MRLEADGSVRKCTPLRWQLIQTADKIVRHGRQIFMKISAAMLDMFATIRERHGHIMRERVPKLDGEASSGCLA